VANQAIILSDQERPIEASFIALSACSSLTCSAVLFFDHFPRMGSRILYDYRQRLGNEECKIRAEGGGK
jgi:hypothetical protein